jgi:glycosyltransferase involved in cell wall biosynthesis
MHSQHPFDVIHVHSVPDFEVFAAWSAKRRGARVILDIHDLVPEFYVSKFGVGKTSLAYRILSYLERMATRFADHVIIANDIWRNTLVGRSVPDDKCTAILNNVDPSVFYRRERTRKDDRFIMVYPGGLQWHQGVDIAVRAFAQMADRVPNAEFHIYGDGSEWGTLERLIRELHMEKRILLKHPVPFHQVPEIMANADLGVVPKRAEGFGDEAYSTKILEFMSQGLPVVASRTRIDQHYFPDGQVCFFESGDATDLALRICELARDPERRQQLAERGEAHAKQNTWACHEQEYLGLTERLIEGGPTEHRRRRRVCLSGPLFFETDNRTLRYAETLRDHGYEVEVVALRAPGQPSHSIVNGISVFRIQERVRNEKGALSYVIRLVSFLLRSLALISWRHTLRPYDIVHTHSIPDFQVFSALLPRLTGTAVILDIYDLLPEFYLSKFGASERSMVYRLLRWQEYLSARFASHVISANHLWQRKLTARAVPGERCTPFINYIDMRLFRLHARRRRDTRCRVIYPGVLNRHQGVDLCLLAFHAFRAQEPQAEFHIYGDGPEKPLLARMIAELGLGDCVHIHPMRPLAEVPQMIADADIGLVGKRADVFGNEAYSTKILEYMSQGVPAVVPRTAIDSYYFPETVVSFYEPGNAADMAARMLALWRNPDVRAQQAARALEYARANSWVQASRVYLALVERLIAGSRARAGGAQL